MSERHKPEYYLPAVYAFLRENGPSQSGEIAEHLGMSSGGASSMLTKLVDKKLLHRDTSGRGSHPRYDVQSFERQQRSPLAGEWEPPEPVVLVRQQAESPAEDEKIAQAAVLLFGDVRGTDLLQWLRWVTLTRELME